jgi:hypothetical protein
LIAGAGRLEGTDGEVEEAVGVVAEEVDDVGPLLEFYVQWVVRNERNWRGIQFAASVLAGIFQ